MEEEKGNISSSKSTEVIKNKYSDSFIKEIKSNGHLLPVMNRDLKNEIPRRHSISIIERRTGRTISVDTKAI